jgi:hypothetical protein
MLKYEDLSAMWVEDSEIDPNDITGETINLGKLHSKYYTMYVEESLRYKRLDAKRHVLSKEKTEYYSGQMDMIEINLRLAYMKSVVDFLESIIRQINGRGYNLRLIFDYERFKSGG